MGEPDGDWDGAVGNVEGPILWMVVGADDGTADGSCVLVGDIEGADSIDG